MITKRNAEQTNTSRFVPVGAPPDRSHRFTCPHRPRHARPAPGGVSERVKKIDQLEARFTRATTNRSYCVETIKSCFFLLANCNGNDRFTNQTQHRTIHRGRRTNRLYRQLVSIKTAEVALATSSGAARTSPTYRFLLIRTSSNPSSRLAAQPMPPITTATFQRRQQLELPVDDVHGYMKTPNIKKKNGRPLPPGRILTLKRFSWAFLTVSHRFAGPDRQRP